MSNLQKPSSISNGTNLELMSRAYEDESSFYFCGESPKRRIENWLLWKEAWYAALKAYGVNIEKTGVHEENFNVL
jgi:hypothetical protein